MATTSAVACSQPDIRDWDNPMGYETGVMIRGLRHISTTLMVGRSLGCSFIRHLDGVRQVSTACGECVGQPLLKQLKASDELSGLQDDRVGKLVSHRLLSDRLRVFGLAAHVSVEVRHVDQLRDAGLSGRLGNLLRDVHEDILKEEVPVHRERPVDHISTKKTSSSKHCCRYSTGGGASSLTFGDDDMVQLPLLDFGDGGRRQNGRGAATCREERNIVFHPHDGLL
ncbi:hypothetical protein EYF80_004723 [Liparis tanakae]|uniref:Uncharacterized protein n=1 Tax=Liparis tanakae TaxID=230148 RepID=A0A4Z2J4C8_9TELE|nr:hypothetical protein EYF80_004723 [Liparis tanakae]